MNSLSVMVYETPLLEKALPRLVEKCLQTGKKIVIVVGTPERALAIDHLLWTYTPISFLPHGCQGQDQNPTEHPIWITSQDQARPFSPIVILVETLNIPQDLEGVEKILVFSLPQERVSVRTAFKAFPQCSFWSQTEAGWKSIP
jgi:DNA polymerase IIIc chi subunit